MAKTRDLLVHVSVEIADGKRKCHHSRGRHFIAKGEVHLAVKGGPYRARRNYCPECATPMLNLAARKLRGFMERLVDSKEA